MFKLPDEPNYDEVGFQTSSHWTEHLCLVGMGTHYQYGQCTSQYQFTSLYDTAGALVGVVNALNLQVALEDRPELIEFLPTSTLLGLVFNESRFDPCFVLEQPRIFMHVYLRLPEVEYQSCVPPTPESFTPANDQVKRCTLCVRASKALVGATCDGTGDSLECCCRISALGNQTGGCRDQGCELPPECEPHDLQDCPTEASTAAGGIRGNSLLLGVPTSPHSLAMGDPLSVEDFM